MDYEVQRPARQCSISGRELAEGELFYSVLIPAGSNVERRDISAEHWTSAPPEAIGWWQSRVPERGAKKPQMAPAEVLLELFRQLDGQPEQQDMRYVLALLLVRRRMLRLEETQHDDAGQETLLLYSPRDENTYEVVATDPDARRAEEIQEELARLLYDSAA